MNVLLVDDDRFITAVLLTKIDWASLHADEVFEAWDLSGAQSILIKTDIGVCVCDIEMPGGNGLDLLQWVRERGLKTRFIFLTDYADFGYAQKALSLQSFDYQLKPIEFDKLTASIKKATDDLMTEETRRNHWEKNYQSIVTMFWRESLSNSLIVHRELLQKELKNRNLEYKSDDYFNICLLRLCASDELAFCSMRSSDIDFTVQGIALKSFLPLHVEAVFPLEISDYVLIVRGMDTRLLIPALKKIDGNIGRCLKKSRLIQSVSYPIIIEDLPNTFAGLRSLIENNLGTYHDVLVLSDSPPHHRQFYEYPPLASFSTLIERRDERQAVSRLENYLRGQSRFLTKDRLNVFKLTLEQLIFSVLHGQGEDAGPLFSESRAQYLSERALNCEDDLRRYLSHVLRKACEYGSRLEFSAAGIALNYLHLHYSEEISRESLADKMGFNVDYLGRVFKKRTGKSIMSYLTYYRMERARELLADADIPIKQAADRVGYSNYSYFSRLFKDMYGLTPSEYRSRHQKIRLS